MSYRIAVPNHYRINQNIEPMYWQPLYRKTHVGRWMIQIKNLWFHLFCPFQDMFVIRLLVCVCEGVLPWNQVEGFVYRIKIVSFKFNRFLLLSSFFSYWARPRLKWIYPTITVIVTCLAFEICIPPSSRQSIPMVLSTRIIYLLNVQWAPFQNDLDPL